MKKTLAIILAALLLSASFVACDNNSDKNEDTTDAATVETTVTTDAATTEEVTTETPAPSEDELAAAASVETIASNLAAKYAEIAGLRESYDQFMADMATWPEEERYEMTFEEFFSAQVAVMPVDTTAEELWLQGFSEAPTGFSEAYLYQPMMMGQAFIGYVFRVAEGTDVETFKQTLKDTSDPRWNICTMANTTVCESFGNLVYFSMMVVADEENPFGFTVEQKDAFTTTFIESITGTAAN